MNRWKRWIDQYLLFVIVSLGVIVIWEVIVQTGRVASFILPAPSSVFVSLWELKQPILFQHLPATMYEVLIGLFLSTVGGVMLAVAMYFYKPVEKSFYPMVIISQTIPLIAISPIFILWFGYTIWSKVAVTVLIAFFPIVVNTYDGLKQDNSPYRELLLSMGASRWQIFKKVQVPLALPSFFSGLKMAGVLSVIGATIGEWLGASEGLGYFARRMSSNLRAEAVFASVVVLSLLGILLFVTTVFIERKTLKWKNWEESSK